MGRYIGIVVILAVCCGCGVIKESSSRQTTEVDRAILQTDHIARQQVTIGQGNRKLNIRHIEWLPPDSTGQQSIKSVTHVFAGEEQKEETVIAETSLCEERVTEEAVVRKEENYRMRCDGRIIPWGIVGCLTVLYFMIRKKVR